MGCQDPERGTFSFSYSTSFHFSAVFPTPAVLGSLWAGVGCAAWGCPGPAGWAASFGDCRVSL